MAVPRRQDSGRTDSCRRDLHSPAWQSQAHHLRQNSSILRFNLGTQQFNPSSRDTSKDLCSHHSVQSSSRLVDLEDEDQHKPCHGDKTEIVILQRYRQILNYPMMCAQIGGLREDPFKSFPVECTFEVSNAYDYYANVHLPSLTRLGNLHLNIPSYFSNILSGPMQFDALIGYTLAIQRVHMARTTRVSKAILNHSNRATTALRERLLSGQDIISDEVILTMVCLITINFFLGNAKALEIHMRGLKQIVAFCGGVENLRGFNGFIKFCVTRNLAAWSAYEKMPKGDLLDGEIESELVYPVHPFSADLCAKLTGFPAGFRELALLRKLSTQCIDFIHRLLLSFQDGSEVMDQLSVTSDELLGRSALTTMERLLATALSAYRSYAECNIMGPNLVWDMCVQAQVRILAVSSDIHVCDLDALSWACLMLRATTEEGTDPWRWVNAKLCMMKVSDRRQEELEEAFLHLPRPEVTAPSRLPSAQALEAVKRVSAL